MIYICWQRKASVLIAAKDNILAMQKYSNSNWGLKQMCGIFRLELKLDFKYELNNVKFL